MLKTTQSTAIYPDQRDSQPLLSPPPLPVFNQSKNTRGNPRNKFTMCITRISKCILDHTEHTIPHPKTPWRLTEMDIPNRVQVFIPDSRPGESNKEEWTDKHIEFAAEIKENPKYLLVYSNGSLTIE